MRPWLWLMMFLSGSIVTTAFLYELRAQSSFSINTDVPGGGEKTVMIGINASGRGYDALNFEVSGLEVVIESIERIDQNEESLLWITQDSVLFYSQNLPNTAWISRQPLGYRVFFNQSLSPSARLRIQCHITSSSTNSEQKEPFIQIALYQTKQPLQKTVLNPDRKIILKR